MKSTKHQNKIFVTAILLFKAYKMAGKTIEQARAEFINTDICKTKFGSEFTVGELWDLSESAYK